MTRPRTLLLQSLDLLVVTCCMIMMGSLLLDKARIPSCAAMPILLGSAGAAWAAWTWKRGKTIRALGRRVFSARRRGALLLVVGALLVCATSFRLRAPSCISDGADLLNYMAYARYSAFQWPVVRANLWTNLDAHSLPVDTQAGLSSVILGVPYYLGLPNLWSVTLVCVVSSALLLLSVRAAMPARFGGIRSLAALACLVYSTFALYPGNGYDKKFHVIILFAWLVARSRPRPGAWDYAMLLLAGLAGIWLHAAAVLSLLAAFGCWRLGAMVAQRSLRPALEIVCVGMGIALGFVLMGNADAASKGDLYSAFCTKFGLGFGMLGTPTSSSLLQSAGAAGAKILAAHGSIKQWKAMFGGQMPFLGAVILACLVLRAHSPRAPRPAIPAVLSCWAYLAAMQWFLYPVLVGIMPTEKRHLLVALSWSLVHLNRWLGSFLNGVACFALCWVALGFVRRLRAKRGAAALARPSGASLLLHLGAAAAIAAIVWPTWGPIALDLAVRVNYHRRHQNYAKFPELRKLDDVCPPGSAVLCHPYYAYNILLTARRVFPISVDAMHTPYTALFFLDPGKRLDDLATLFSTSDPAVAHRILNDYQTRYILLDDQVKSAKVDFLRFMGGVETVLRSEREGWTLVRFPERPVPSPYRVRHFSPKALAAGNLREQTPSIAADRYGDLTSLTGLNEDYLSLSAGNKVVFPIAHEKELAFVGLRYINYGAEGEFTLRLVPADATGPTPEIKIAYGPSHAVYFPAYSRATWELPRTASGTRYNKLIIESRQPASMPAVIDQIVLVERIASTGEDKRE